MKYFVAGLIICLVLNITACALKKEPKWIQETAEAAWQARDSQGEFVYDGNMWIMGGWYSTKVPNPRDVWKSPDGKKWTRVVETAPWKHSDLSASLVFRNKMWMMGGRMLPGGNAFKDETASNAVWSSIDGAKWTLETAEGGWSPRFGAGFVVFKDRMWVLGGTNNFYNNNDTTTVFNDVWSSADGKDWKLEQANAPWAKRPYSQAVVFDGKIWLMGGGLRAPETIPTNEIWNSEDGVNWNLVTDAAPWKPRLWFSTVVYRDRMWVLGGWAEEGNLGDVWYSKDGLNWTEFKTDVIWSKRHEHSTFVFDDKIWVTGGAAEPNYKMDNEVWSLKIPVKWFSKNKQ